MEALTKPNQTQLSKNRHWTDDSPLRMVRSISSDYIAQLEIVMEQSGCNHGLLAKRLGVTLGRVSQMLNSPGNFTLKNGVLYAGAVDKNVAMVIYDATDSGGPISGDVFRTCWEIAGRPKNMFDIQENTVGFVSNKGGIAAIGHAWTAPINPGGGTNLVVNCTAQTDYRKQFISDVRFDTKSS
jgi:hypothetical protein